MGFSDSFIAPARSSPFTRVNMVPKLCSLDWAMLRGLVCSCKQVLRKRSSITTSKLFTCLMKVITRCRIIRRLLCSPCVSGCFGTFCRLNCSEVSRHTSNWRWTFESLVSYVRNMLSFWTPVAHRQDCCRLLKCVHHESSERESRGCLPTTMLTKRMLTWKQNLQMTNHPWRW